MSDKSLISWTDATWNFLRGCSQVSAGCTNCYAQRQAHRFSGEGMPYEDLTRMTLHGPVWNGRTVFVHEKLYEPLFWTRPRKIFVNSMSDLWHERFNDRKIAEGIAVMAMAQQHTFQVLTKRPERMQEFLTQESHRILDAFQVLRIDCEQQVKFETQKRRLPVKYRDNKWPGLPLPNVWWGVSCEDQETFDERVDYLVKTPAAVRFVSLEPLLGPVNCEFNEIEIALERDGAGNTAILGGLDWVIIGGESGPNARGCNLEWIRNIVKDCKEYRVACFVKQLGSRPNPVGDGHISLKPGYKWDEPELWPDDLKVREFPDCREGN